MSHSFLPRASLLALLLTASHASAGTLAQTNPVGDPARGKIAYQACGGCHSLDDNDVGPRHRGVVGRRAGAVAGYAYSPALRASGIVWNEGSLDRWLVNPQALVPGSKMYFSVSNAQARADIIAYLRTQTDPVAAAPAQSSTAKSSAAKSSPAHRPARRKSSP